MDGYIVHGGIGMVRGDLARIEDGKGVLVYVWHGQLWITQERDRRDYFIKAGERFKLDRAGVTVIYAMRRSALTLTAPVPAHYAKRITLAPPTTSAPRVLYDRAQEPGGWLDYARQRLSRHQFAPPVFQPHYRSSLKEE